ncbi:MAG: BON domain-containing protein [Zoogloeaceae bacterium]|nr:BON domain-containing protein [Rhodocyclaceae bacterium]MCP5235244.1 BON domain-containing protein [Zoogloeaceae bacterium]
MKLDVRGSLLCLTLVAGIVPALQGCFPVVAAGAATGAMMAADRRSSGAYVEDEGLEWKVGNRIKERFGDAAHVNVTAFNRVVLLTGEISDEAGRSALDQIAAGVPNVRGVTNEVQVAGASSLTSRGNDAVVTSKVKARFVDDNGFSANHVKVVTEAGTVFLMGLVTREEADQATEIARTTSGVRKVVRVFEYITAEEARNLQLQSKQTNGKS